MKQVFISTIIFSEMDPKIGDRFLDRGISKKKEAAKASLNAYLY